MDIRLAQAVEIENSHEKQTHLGENPAVTLPVRS